MMKARVACTDGHLVSIELAGAGLSFTVQQENEVVPCDCAPGPCGWVHRRLTGIRSVTAKWRGPKQGLEVVIA